MASLVRKIVSGGQTGIDRAALDAAIFLDIDHGGWCPAGRLAEDGTIPAVYQLVETESRDYAERTERNVVDSDGTLILYWRKLSGGSLFTERMAQKHRRPCLTVDLAADLDLESARAWLSAHQIEVLNVAGPRASTAPEAIAPAEHFLLRLLEV
jgi:hypothetical protein